MAKNDRNLNINIVNPEEESEVIISFSTFFKKLKKYAFLWLVAAAVAMVLAFVFAIITTHVKKAPLEALIGFSYDGIEKGKDPRGRKFDINTVKNPKVIEMALSELQMDLVELENIRQGISFRGLIPEDTMDRFVIYNNILDQATNSSLTAAERMLDTSYHSTQFVVEFDYSATEFDDDQAEAVLNMILEKYTDYFYELYGYNEAVGSSLAAIDYTTYDYSEALDVFATNIKSLKRYVKQLADEDDTRFRSSETGYTFSDLYDALKTVETLDIDNISSYISINNVTKNKDLSMAYYELRIKALNREKTEYEERLEVISKSISDYEKDQIIVFGGTDDVNTQSKVASDQYDRMFRQQIELSASLADVKQSIAYYKERLEQMKKGATGSQAMQDHVAADLAVLNEKVAKLSEAVCETSEDYYRNVTFVNAYNVLVPAVSEASKKLSRIVGNAKLPLVALEFLALAAFFGIAFVEALIADSRKNKALKAAKAAETEGSDADTDAEDNADERAEEAEADEDKKKKKK